MKPYGCHNTDRKDDYYVPVRPYNWQLIKDTSSKECQYRKTTIDPRCTGCKK